MSFYKSPCARHHLNLIWCCRIYRILYFTGDRTSSILTFSIEFLHSFSDHFGWSRLYQKIQPAHHHLNLIWCCRIYRILYFTGDRTSSILTFSIEFLHSFSDHFGWSGLYQKSSLVITIEITSGVVGFIGLIFHGWSNIVYFDVFYSIPPLIFSSFWMRWIVPKSGQWNPISAISNPIKIIFCSHVGRVVGVRSNHEVLD